MPALLPIPLPLPLTPVAKPLSTLSLPITGHMTPGSSSNLDHSASPRPCSCSLLVWLSFNSQILLLLCYRKIEIDTGKNSIVSVT
ncbi:hypothetical protein PGT21_020281 [Puccinia graminis f. sp. tritici]|uniref:Uncharacterized protein n=1 Tax=Puccinia graminis f. sp. tritici TaxID=56615 RepID=A0A5B0SAG7_PUCGR|nr:hypothetical protein PGT21_020281 [Puccinia graminis f. sp. tritici]KAA1135106.1 hypothetical protein PGTUg99_012647 [Puccinia graminis f. sp. tritici]